MTKRSPDAYRCPTCNGKIVPALYFDGEQTNTGHEYQWVCRGECGKSYGESWVTSLWSGKSEPRTQLPFEAWDDEMPLKLTQQLIRPRVTAWGAELLKHGMAGIVAYLIIIVMLNLPHVKAVPIFGSMLI